MIFTLADVILPYPWQILSPQRPKYYDYFSYPAGHTTGAELVRCPVARERAPQSTE